MSDFVIKEGILFDYIGTDTDVVIPDGISRIGQAFRGKNVTSVVMPDVSILCSMAFADCAQLRNVKFSAKLRGIYVGAFRGCACLTEITLPETLRMIDVAAFSACSGLTSVTIPKGVTVIRDGAFLGCSALRAIALPKDFLFGEDLLVGRTDLLSTLRLWDPEDRPAERVLTVRYAGNKARWKAISAPIDTSFLSVVHCSDGDIRY